MANKIDGLLVLDNGITVGLGPISLQIIRLLIEHQPYIEGEFHAVDIEFNVPQRGQVKIKTRQHHII